MKRELSADVRLTCGVTACIADGEADFALGETAEFVQLRSLARRDEHARYVGWKQQRRDAPSARWRLPLSAQSEASERLVEMLVAVRKRGSA